MELMEKQGLKQTELGLIPEDWKLSILNDLTDITRLAGYEYSTLWEETTNGEIIALRGFNIGQNKIIERDFVNISDSLSKRLIRSRLFRNDVIYPCVGSIGNAVVIEEDDKYHIQQNIAKITPKKGKIFSHYLAYYLMSEFGLKEIERFNGSSSQPNILVGSLRQYLVVTPTLTEQKAIATALSDVDALIASLEQTIIKKKAIKQGAMQQLLKPPHKGGKRLPRFSGDWVEKTLGECLKYEQPTNYIVDNSDYEGQSQTPVLTAGKSFLLGYTDEEFGIFMDYPVIIFDDFTTSKQFVDFSFKVKSSAMKMLKPVSNEIDISFMFTIMNLIRFSLGDDHKRRWITEYSKIEIFIPKIKEQLAISDIIGNMDAEITQLETKKEKYQAIKQGMMQELLTGKTRLV